MKKKLAPIVDDPDEHKLRVGEIVKYGNEDGWGIYRVSGYRSDGSYALEEAERFFGYKLNTDSVRDFRIIPLEVFEIVWWKTNQKDRIKYPDPNGWYVPKPPPIDRNAYSFAGSTSSSTGTYILLGTTTCGT